MSSTVVVRVVLEESNRNSSPFVTTTTRGNLGPEICPIFFIFDSKLNFVDEDSCLGGVGQK